MSFKLGRMTVSTVTRICDKCGTIADQSETTFGGSVFSQWLTVTQTHGSTRVPMPDGGPWDFCSIECCVSFLSDAEGTSRPRVFGNLADGD